MTNKILIFIIVPLFSIIFYISEIHAATGNSESCAAYLTAEADSGDIIESLAADEARPPASMAKLMTAYVILKKISQGQLAAESTITISAQASKVGGSQVYLKQGEAFTINQLLEALLIQSANDAALALAEYASGSRASFVEEMNSEAKKLGMSHASFNSPHGLPPGKDQAEDLVSPSDMLILSRALLSEFPSITDITGKQVEQFRDGTFEMRNHNGLLRTFDGTDGLKTGFYNEAGFCVTASAKRNGVRLIAVLMGCPSRKIRDQQAAELLNKSFNQYKKIDLLKAGESVIPGAAVRDGIKPLVRLIAKDNVQISARMGAEQQIEKRVRPCEQLTAPITMGLSCGAVEFIKGAKVIGSTALLVAEDVERAGLTRRLLGKLGL